MRTETHNMQGLTRISIPRHSADVQDALHCTQNGEITGKHNHELVSGSEIFLMTLRVSFNIQNFILPMLCLLLTTAVPDSQHTGAVQHTIPQVSHWKRVSCCSTRKDYLNFETPVLGLHEYSSLLRHCK